MATRRYPAGGSYRGQYSYNQPSISQYESFFNPIPVEFLQQQFDRRQGAYDTAFAGTLAAKEQMIQEQAALSDLASKNEIISGAMTDINKTVNEKYGGDWGRAAKEVAKMVTGVRQNPFWQTTKYLSEQQKAQQEFALEHGRDALIYRDVLGQTAIDPETGQVRTPQDLTFDAEIRGDWQGSVKKQFSGLKGDKLQTALRRAGISAAILESDTIETLSDDKLQALATDDAIIQSFLAENPDFKRSKMEIEGMTEEQIKDAASDFIYGQIAPGIYKDVTTQRMTDQLYLQNLKARAAGTTTSGIVVGNAGDFINLTVDDPNAAARQIRQVKQELEKMPDGPQKEALQAEYDRDIRNRDFLMHSVQQSPSAVNFDSHYDNYVKWADDNNQTPVSASEFEDQVFNAVREGDLPEREKAFSTSYGGGYNLNNAARQAGRELNRAMRNFVDNEGQFAMNVNVLSGETGRKDVDTYVGRLNNEITTLWKKGTTGFTIPYSNQQIGTILEEDKRYNGKKKNTLARDPSKDELLMTDGTMDGKVVYQLNIHDKNGKVLGSEYITPDNQTIAQGNTVNAANELITSGDPTKQHIGIQILGNVQYGSVVQSADVHNNSEGGFGVQYEGSEIMFEKIPGQTEQFRLYIVGDNNEKDYFRDENGNILAPTTEKEIQYELMRASMYEQQAQNQ